MTHPYVLILLKKQADMESALSSLVDLSSELALLKQKVKRLERKRFQLIEKAYINGASQNTIAVQAKISRTRVKQIIHSKPNLQTELEKYQQEIRDAARPKEDL